MPLSRKDFEALAAAVKDAKQPALLPLADAAAEATRRRIAKKITDFCAGQNPRFDRARFLKACGIEE